MVVVVKLVKEEAVIVVVVVAVPVVIVVVPTSECTCVPTPVCTRECVSGAGCPCDVPVTLCSNTCVHL